MTQEVKENWIIETVYKKRIFIEFSFEAKKL